MAALVASCSSGANRLSGQQCRKNMNPVAMNVDPHQKVQLRASALPVGTYELAQALLFFKGDPTPTSPEGFQVLIREEVPKKSRGGELRTSTDCFRNSMVTEEYSARVEGLSGLVVENGRAISTIKTFGFTMSEDGQFELVSAPSDQKPSQPQDVFAKADETFVVTHGPNDFEIRTKGRGVHGTYFLSTFLHKTK